MPRTRTVSPLDQRTSDALVVADRVIMRAYQLEQTRRNQELADELFDLHIWLAGSIEYLLGTRRRRPTRERDRA